MRKPDRSRAGTATPLSARKDSQCIQRTTAHRFLTISTATIMASLARRTLAGVSYGINSNFAQDKDDKRLSTNRCVYTEWARPFSSQSLSSFEIDTVSRPLYICDQWLYAQAGEGVRSFGRRLERVVYTPASP